MSDTNRVRLSFIEESTRGTTPAGNLKILPYASHGLVTTPQSTTSAIIQDGGNVKDSSRTDMQSAGNINSELGHEFCDPFLESAYRSDFETQISLSGTTFSIDASGSPVTLDDSGSGLGDLKPNDVIMISGFTTTDNNGAFVVGGNTAAGSVDIIKVRSASTPATEAAGDSVTITTTRLTNANTSKFFSIEEFNTLTNVYRAWLGMECDGFTLTFGAGAVTTTAFNFIGSSEPDIEATIGDGYDAASTNEVINTENGYLGSMISVNGAALAAPTACVTGITYTIANSVRREKGLNCVIIGKGKFNMTVNFTMVFENKTIYDAFLADQKISIGSAAVDSSNQGIGIVIPEIRITSASAPVSGGDQTMIATFQGQAIGATVGSDTYTSVLSKLG